MCFPIIPRECCRNPPVRWCLLFQLVFCCHRNWWLFCVRNGPAITHIFHLKLACEWPRSSGRVLLQSPFHRRQTSAQRSAGGGGICFLFLITSLSAPVQSLQQRWKIEPILQKKKSWFTSQITRLKILFKPTVRGRNVWCFILDSLGGKKVNNKENIKRNIKTELPSLCD